MGILSQAFERRELKLGDQVLDWIVGAGASSGVPVTHNTALAIGAVFACVRVLSETLASLPLHLYERRPDGAKRRATGHPLYPVLHDMANPEMSSFTLRETLQAHVVTWGNGYAEIELGNAGEVRGLWPLRPDRTEPQRLRGELYYRTERARSVGGGPVWIPAERILHLHGLGFDGLQGYSVIRMFREGLGLALATEKYGATFFGNGARPGMVLKHPGILKDEARKNLRESWIARHGGLDNANRVAILEEGMTIETIGLPPEEAQFLATRKFQVNEVARIYRVPPHLIGDLDRATFSNIEHQSIEFVVHTMRPWLVRWEQEIARQLLMPSERARYYAEFLVDGLLRGDAASRYGAYAVGRQNGWLSANDVRRLENMDPIEGGDVYLIPLNMVPAEAAGKAAVAGADSRELSASESRTAAAGIARQRLIGPWRRQYATAAGRLVRRETNDVLNRARRFARAGDASPNGDVGGLLLWLDEFYREFLGVVAGELRPVHFSYGELVAAQVAEELGRESSSWREIRDEDESQAPWAPFVQRYTEAGASRHAARSKDRIAEVVRRAMEKGEPWFEALEAEFDHWREVRPDEIAADESVRFNSALAVHLYTVAGVRYLRWLTVGKACPYCRALDGKRIAIDSSFLGEGDFQPEGAEKPLTVSRKVGHAPAHKGCNCVTVSA